MHAIEVGIEAQRKAQHLHGESCVVRFITAT